MGKKMPNKPDARAVPPYENEIEKKSKIFGETKIAERVRKEKEVEEMKQSEGRRKMRERIKLLENRTKGRETTLDKKRNLVPNYGGHREEGQGGAGDVGDRGEGKTRIKMR